MNLSERSISALGRIVTGDQRISPYRSGPHLVRLFNEFGGNDVYGRGFPSMGQFAESHLRRLNGTNHFCTLIKEIFDPRDFLDAGMELQPAIDYLNLRFKYDGYEIFKDGDFVKVHDLERGVVEIANSFSKSNEDGLHFIDEQILKSEQKIQCGDYDGAISNARSLLEAVLVEIERKCADSTTEYNGDLLRLFRRVQKHLNLNPAREDIDSALKQVLSGLVSVVSGLAGLRNKMSDAHVRSYKPSKHHAMLVANASKTVVNFLYGTYDYQKKKIS